MVKRSIVKGIITSIACMVSSTYWIPLHAEVVQQAIPFSFQASGGITFLSNDQGVVYTGRDPIQKEIAYEPFDKNIGILDFITVEVKIVGTKSTGLLSRHVGRLFDRDGRSSVRSREEITKLLKLDITESIGLFFPAATGPYYDRLIATYLSGKQDSSQLVSMFRLGGRSSISDYTFSNWLAPVNGLNAVRSFTAQEWKDFAMEGNYASNVSVPRGKLLLEHGIRYEMALDTVRLRKVLHMEHSFKGSVDVSGVVTIQFHYQPAL